MPPATRVEPHARPHASRPSRPGQKQPQTAQRARSAVSDHAIGGRPARGGRRGAGRPRRQAEGSVGHAVPHISGAWSLHETGKVGKRSRSWSPMNRPGADLTEALPPGHRSGLRGDLRAPQRRQVDAAQCPDGEPLAVATAHPADNSRAAAGHLDPARVSGRARRHAGDPPGPLGAQQVHGRRGRRRERATSTWCCCSPRFPPLRDDGAGRGVGARARWRCRRSRCWPSWAPDRAGADQARPPGRSPGPAHSGASVNGRHATSSPR